MFICEREAFLVKYFEFPRRLAHFVIAKVHHEHGQRILSLLPHVSVPVLQAGVKLRDAQHQVPRCRPQAGELLR